MFKDDYEDAELKLQCLEQFGVDNWEGYDLAIEEYDKRLDVSIERVNTKVDTINGIITHLDTPNKIASFLFGLVGMVQDPNIFIAKVLMALDEESLDTIDKDFNQEAREVVSENQQQKEEE